MRTLYLLEVERKELDVVVFAKFVFKKSLEQTDKPSIALSNPPYEKVLKGA